MAVLLMEGFEKFELFFANQMTQIGSEGTPEVGYGGSGQSYRNTAGNYFRNPVTQPSVGDFRTVACAFRYESPVPHGSVMRFPGYSESTTWSETTSDFLVSINPDGVLSIRYSSSDTFYSEPGLMVHGAWHWISWSCQWSSTAQWTVSVNGAEIASSATHGTGNPTGEGWNYLFAPGNYSSGSYWLDDLIVTDQFETIPPTKVLDFAPTSTSTGQWTGSDGNSVDNHLLVNDPTDTATYVEASSAGLTDLYGFSPGLTADPRAVQFFAQCRYDGVGDGTMDMVASSGGTEATKSIVPVDVWSPYRQELNTDPNTGAPWTAAAANAALLGVRTT